MKTYGILIDLFDHSGHANEEYKRNNWHVFQVDIKNGIDILEWDYKEAIFDWMSTCRYSEPNCEFVFGILAAVPCTEYATSGARHFARKDADGTTEKSQLLVDKTKEIIDWVDSRFNLLFWKVENPRSRIHTLNPWLGKIRFKFNPCDFAGYTNIIYDLDNMDQLAWLKNQDISKVDKHYIKLVIDCNTYNKETWLWGKFNIPKKDRFDPTWKDSPMFILYGGKSERTKELRSIDPKGFCKAFYEANNIE
jgi:hypothetical protein